MIYEDRMSVFQMFCDQFIRATSFSKLQIPNTFINEFKTNSRLVKVIGIITKTGTTINYIAVCS